MQKRQPTRTWELPARWDRLGRALLEARGVHPDHYQRKTVKERLMDAMALPHIGALVDNARELDGLDADEVLDRLALDRGTQNRWLREAFQPHARNFFGLLVVGLRREVDEVVLPRNRTVIWESVRRTMAIIGEKELGRAWRVPKPEEFACVRCLMQHPHADQLAPWGEDEQSPDPELVDQVLAHVLRETDLKSAAEIVSIIKDWAEPYVLFRIGLLWEWRFLDEDAV